MWSGGTKMNRKRRYTALFLLFFAVICGAYLTWALNHQDAPFEPFKPHTPYPGTVYPESTPEVVSRSIPINLDPAHQSGMYFLSWSTLAMLTPVPRPTDHPLYPSYYPLGLDALTYISTNDPGPDGSIDLGLWDTTPSDCTSTWCAQSNINWTPINDVVAASKARTVKLGDGTSIYQPISLDLPGSYLDGQNGVCGTTPSDPCNSLHLPSWMGTDAYYDFLSPSGRYFRTVRWDSPMVKARFKQLIYEAAQRYKSNADWQATIRQIRVYIGLAGETTPVQARGWTSDDGTDTQRQLLKAAEDELTELITGAPPTSSNKWTGCDKYLTFIREITEYTYEQFKDVLPVLVMDAPAPCSTDNHPSFDGGDKLRSYLYTNATYGWEVVSPKKKIGSSVNGMGGQIANADTCPTCLRQGWQWKTTGETLSTYSDPFTMESGYNPGTLGSVWDNWQDQFWSALSICQVKGDNFMMNSRWQPYMSTEMWRVLENCLGRKTGMSFIQFRNSELTTARYASGSGYAGPSDYRGSYGSWLSLVNYNNYNQACTPFFKTVADNDYSAAVAAGWTIDRRACPTTLPTPVITPNPTATPDSPDMTNRLYNRQVLQIEADSDPNLYRLDVKLDTAHPLYGQEVNLSVDIVYFDKGTDKFFVNFPRMDGDLSQILVTKTNTNKWVVSKGNVLYNMKMANSLIGLSENVFFFVGNDATGPDYVAAVYVEPTPVNGVTPTVTVTDTVTPDVTPTFTPTPTPQPTPTPVYGLHISEIANNPMHDWNLSGSVNAADRWFEVTNWTGSPVNLKGYLIQINAMTMHQVSGNAVIPAYGRRVFTSETLGGNMISDAGTLRISDTYFTLVASLTYGVYTNTECVGTRPEGSEIIYAEPYCTPGQPNANPN